jgi:hypothetical protein
MYIAENGDEVAPPQEVPTVNGQVVALQETVNSGRVSLDPATGEELRKMLLEQMDQVDSWLERAGRLARPAPIGRNPVGDPRSFVAVMTAYREVLQQTHDSVRNAIRNFTAVDDESSVELRKLSGN